MDGSSIFELDERPNHFQLIGIAALELYVGQELYQGRLVYSDRKVAPDFGTEFEVQRIEHPLYRLNVSDFGLYSRNSACSIELILWYFLFSHSESMFSSALITEAWR